MKTFEIRAYWSTESNDWRASNDELPVTAEAPSIDALFVEVKSQAAEMAALNGIVAGGEEIGVRLIYSNVCVLSARVESKHGGRSQLLCSWG
jgi:hypothetical protein